MRARACKRCSINNIEPTSTSPITSPSLPSKNRRSARQGARRARAQCTMFFFTIYLDQNQHHHHHHRPLTLIKGCALCTAVRSERSITTCSSGKNVLYAHHRRCHAMPCPPCCHATASAFFLARCAPCCHACWRKRSTADTDHDRLVTDPN